MNKFLKYIIFTFLLTALWCGKAEAGITESLMDSLDLTEFNTDQQSILQEEIAAYTSEINYLYETDNNAWKAKIDELLSIIRDGLRIYKLSRDPEIERMILEFDETAQTKFYIITYVEDAFLNNLFLRFAEAYYQTTRPYKYVIAKYKYLKTPSYTIDNPKLKAGTPDIKVARPIEDKIGRKLSELTTTASIDVNYNIADGCTMSDNQCLASLTKSVDGLMKGFLAARIQDIEDVEVVAGDCSNEITSPKLKDLALRSKDCDTGVDDEIEEITFNDLKGLCLTNRENLLKCVDDFPAKGADDITLLNLIKSTPVSDRRVLLTWLKDDKELENLIESIDGDEFISFLNELSSWKGKPTQTNFENSVVSQKLFFFNPGDGLPYTFNGQGNMEFKSRKNFTFTFEQTLVVDPFEWVTVVFLADFVIGGQSFKAGEIKTYTGLGVWSLFNESETKKIKLAISLAIDIPLLYVGYGEIRLARNLVGLAKALKTARGITSIAVASTGLAMVYGLEDELSLTEEGKDVLAYWTYFNLIYSGAILSPIAIKNANNLYKSCQTLLKKPNLKESLRGGVTKMMEDLKGLFKSKGLQLEEGIDVIDNLTALRNFATTNKVSNLAWTFEDILKFSNNDLNLAQKLIISCKEIQPGKSVAELFQHFNLPLSPSSASLSNYQARIWYTFRKSQIASSVDYSKGYEAAAKQSLAMRNNIRATTRNSMKDIDWANFLDTQETMMTWEQAVAKYSSKFSGDELYKEIINASMRGRPKVDDLFKIPK